jgi:hypothetical protein
MTLQSSGAISLSQIQTEFGGSNPVSMSEYYAGGSFVPSGATGTNGAVPSSGTVSLSKFYGTVKTAFSPAGGTSAGSPQALSDFGTFNASVTISCTTPAVWTWTRSGNTNANASVSSGGSATEITFSLSTTGFTYRQSEFTVSATSNGITRYWFVTLTAEGNA